MALKQQLIIKSENNDRRRNTAAIIFLIITLILNTLYSVNLRNAIFFGFSIDRTEKFKIIRTKSLNG